MLILELKILRIKGYCLRDGRLDETGTYVGPVMEFLLSAQP
jgi:hypothetical protein